MKYITEFFCDCSQNILFIFFSAVVVFFDGVCELLIHEVFQTFSDIISPKTFFLPHYISPLLSELQLYTFWTFQYYLCKKSSLCACVCVTVLPLNYNALPLAPSFNVQIVTAFSPHPSLSPFCLNVLKS
jgi:hypothetical protein